MKAIRYAPTIAGALLGLLFVVFGLNFFLNFLPAPPGPPEGSPAALFFGALAPTGYFAFIKVMEIVGGVLVAVPKTRNFGLVVLGPIIVNILCFHIFLTDGSRLLDPVLLLICALTLYQLWSARRAIVGLLN